MPNYNKITIMGHLGRDPVLKYLPSGSAVCDFSVATSEKRDGQETVTWFRITCWNKTAEAAGKYLAKGRPVYIEGRLKQSEYVDKEGGKRTTLEVTATELQFLGSRDEADAPPQARAASSSDDDFAF